MILFLALLACLVFAGALKASTLSDLIAGMPSDSWATIMPANPNVIGGGLTTSYADSGAWDPISKKFFFLGSDHASPYEFAIWDDATNSWTSGPALPGVPKSTIFVGHAFDGNTSDYAGNIYYRCRRGTCGNDIYKYSVTAGTWSILPNNTAETNENNDCCTGIAYFPDMGGLVWITNTNGQVWFYSPVTNAWTQRATVSNYAAGTWAFAEYNPIKHMVLFGSANGKLFKLSSAGVVTQLANIPVSIYDGSGYAGHVSVDPVSGLFIVLTSGTHQCKTYDVDTDAWGNCANPPTALQGKALASAPVTNYGATMFMNCGSVTGKCLGDIYVYKHASSGVVPPLGPTNLVVK